MLRARRHRRVLPGIGRRRSSSARRSALDDVGAAPRRPPAPRAWRARAHPSRRRAPSRSSSRNPFDSVTGPLQRRSRCDTCRRRTGRPHRSALGAGLRRRARSAIITESTDPAWSFAALQGPGTPQPRFGASATTWAASRSRSSASIRRRTVASVWLDSGASLCQVMLFSAQPAGRRAPAARARAGARSPPPAGRSPPGAAGHRLEDSEGQRHRVQHRSRRSSTRSSRIRPS